MGFNFGAFLGGAASQIVEDIDEQEKEVKLRTRTILDRQVAEAAENRKKFQDDKEKVEKQIMAMAQLFGEDDKFRFNKARAIVAGGDEHYNTMYKELSTHKKLGGDMNVAYDYVGAKEEQGFEGVADAAKGLVKLRTIEAPEFTESVRSDGARLFGIDAKSMYEKARSQYEQAGLLPNSKEQFQDSVQKYGTGTINFQNLKKDKESIDKMYANNMQSILELNPDDPKYKEKRAKLEAEQEKILKGVAKMNTVSASVIATKLREEGGEGKTTSQHANLYSKALSEFKQGLGYSKTDKTIINEDGKELYNEEATEYFNSKIKEWKQNYVKGMVDGKGDLIDDTSDTKSFLDAFGLTQYVGVKPEEEGTKKPAGKKAQINSIVEGSPEVTIDVVKQIRGVYPTISQKDLFRLISIKYPRKEAESQDAYLNRIGGIVRDVFAEENKNKIDDTKLDEFFKVKKKEKGTEKPTVVNNKGEEITNPNFKYSGAM
tara:strand:+ start:1711 stop:3171 length:1461 start_codon:yes stop_codon:yes gene_type:complete